MLSSTKQFTRWVLQTGGVLLYHLGLGRWVIAHSKRTRVVLYHSVEEVAGSYTRGLGTTVTPATFALHLEYYRRFYNVISMHEYLCRKSVKPVNPRAVSEARLLITFDDGYASVLDNALPLLEAQAMPATTYLIGNAVRGRMIWVNRLNQALNDYPSQTREVLSTYPRLAGLDNHAIIHHIQTMFEPGQIESLIETLELTVPELTARTEKLFCTPNDVRQMQSRGMEFGFHSNHHWNLARCKDSELVATLATDGLTDLLSSNTFAYPFGYFAPSAIGRLTREGYQQLLTVGSNNDRFSALHLDRIEIFDTSFARMFARLEIEEPVIAAARQWLGRWRSQAREIMARSEKHTA